MQCYQLINESNKFHINKPPDVDRVYYSELHEWFTRDAFRSFSLKCVLEDQIAYKVGKHEYIVHSDQFLLAIRQPHAQAYFKSSQLVKSICVDISDSTVSQVFTLLTERTATPDFDNYLAGYFKYPEFDEHISFVQNSPAGTLLEQLIRQIRNNKFGVSISSEWMYGLVEGIVHQEFPRFVSLRKLNRVRMATRKEIYRRLTIGKEYLDAYFMTIERIKEAAQASLMSEYHFIRCFQQVYLCSPYQYVLNKKLEYAFSLLQAGELKVGVIAQTIGFGDVSAFSKAFRRKYGYPPSRVSLSR